jgi:hypothetical protein
MVWTGALAVLVAAPAAASGVHVNFGTNVITVRPGAEFMVQLWISQADAEFNAFDAEVDFDPSRLTSVALSPLSDQIGPLMSGACGQTFHRFTQHPNYLEIHLGLLCNQTFVTGPGVIYRVKFRASSVDTGTTYISYGPATSFFRAGVKITPLETHRVAVVVTNNPVGVVDRAPDPFTMAAPLPNPRAGGARGRFAFSLPRAGAVGLDLLDSSGRRVARREPANFPAGHHALELEATDLSPGIYFARMTTGWGESQWKRWVVLK